MTARRLTPVPPLSETLLTLPELGEPWLVLHREVFEAIMQDRQRIIDSAAAFRAAQAERVAAIRADADERVRRSNERWVLFLARREAAKARRRELVAARRRAVIGWAAVVLVGGGAWYGVIRLVEWVTS